MFTLVQSHSNVDTVQNVSDGERHLIIIIIIIIITTTIFIVLSSTAPAICESSLWFIWAKVGQLQVAANSQAKLQT